MKYRSLYDFWRKLKRSGKLSPDWGVYQLFLQDNLSLYKPGTIPSRIDPGDLFRRGNIKWIQSRRLANYPANKILQMYEEGYSQKVLGEIFHISQSTINRILRDLRDKKET